jgi:hypothetical protein
MATTEASIAITAQDRFSAVFGQATAGLGKLQQSATQLSNVLGGIAAGGFVASLGAMVRSTINLADQLNKLSQRTGFTVESLSAIKNAAELADVSTEEFTGGIRRLNLALVEAQDGTSKTAQIFRALGVDTTRGAEVALRGISDAFNRLPDGATKAAVATEIFGRAGEKLIPLLNGGSTAIDQARASAERYGTLISGKLAADAEAFNDNLTKLRQSASALGVSLTSQLLPGLTTITDNLVKGRERGQGFLQTLIEIDKLAASALGGIENLFTGGGGRFDRLAQETFERAGRFESGRGNTLREDRGVIRRPAAELVGPELPAGRVPDPAALARALLGNRGNRSDSGRTPVDVLTRSMIENLRPDDDTGVDIVGRIEGVNRRDEQAAREQQELLGFYADLAMAQQLRIELAQQEGERAAESLQREADAILDRLDPTREYIRALERVAELQEKGLLSDAQAIAETNRLADALRRAGKAATDSNDLARSLGLTFSSAFEGAIAGGKGLRDILKSIESDLLRLGTRELVTRPFLDFLGTAAGGKSGSEGLGNIFNSVLGAIGFGGARAAGGPVMAGMGYLVGERGPEMFMPRQSGTIIPNGAMGGMNVTVNVQARDMNSFRGSEAQIAASVAASLGRAQRRNG